jgi:CHAT domain-containing protein
MLKRTLILVLSLCCISIISFAQTDDDKEIERLKAAIHVETDTIKLVQLYSQLSGVYGYIDVRKTIIYADIALDLSRKVNYKKGEAVAYLRKGQAFNEIKNTWGAMGEFSKAEALFVEIDDAKGEFTAKSNIQSMWFIVGLVSKNAGLIKEKINLLKEYSTVLITENDSSQVSINYHNISLGYIMLEGFGEMTNAKDSVQKYLNLATQYNNNPNNDYDYFVAELEKNKAAVYYGSYHQTGNKSMLLKAKDKYLNALEMFIEQGNKEKEFIIQGDLAAIYFFQGDYIKGFEYSKKQFEIIDSVKNIYKKGIFYRNLGAYYLKIGDLDRGAKFTNLAASLSIVNEEAYINLGIAYLNNNGIEKAKSYLYDSIDYKLIVENQNEKLAGLILYGRGLIEQKDSQYIESIDLFDTAFVKLEGQFKKWEALTIYERGKSYALSGNLKKGEEDIKNAIFMLSKKEGFYAEKALFENTLGEIYAKKSSEGYLENAIVSYQKAINLTITEYTDFNINSYENPPLDSIKRKNIAVVPIANKGKALVKFYKKNKDIDYLLAGIESLELAINILDDLRLYYAGNSATIQLVNDQLSFIFEELTDAYFILAATKPQNTQNEDLQKAFRIIEKNKSYVLFIKLLKSSLTVDKLLGNPYSEKDKLINHLHLLNNVIADNKKNDSYNLLKKNMESRSEVYDFLKSIDKTFFEYMYNEKVSTIEQAQNELADNQAIVEYYNTNDFLYCFVITKDDFQTYELSIDALEEATKLFKCIEEQGKSLTIGQLKKNNKNFINYSYKLYNSLLKEPLSNISDSINRLIIMPTDALQKLSFDALICKKTTDTKFDYTTLDYVVRDYAISYVHSSTILQELNKIAIADSNLVQVYAASYPTQNISSNLGTKDNCQKIFESVEALSFDQANIIDKTFDNSIYWKGDKATKANFIKNCTIPSVMTFLSMHGCIDENAEQSRLLFSGAGNYYDTTNTLSVADIYGLKINTNLAFLNACVTGKDFNNSKSEGFTSIARAFQYAGCPSIVMSRWAVSQKASIDITQQFVNALNDNKGDQPTIDVALQQAKLKYLKSSSGKYSKPFYWSVFVPLGRANIPIVK